MKNKFMDKECCHTQNNQSTKTQKVDPFLAGIVVFTILLLGVAVYFGTKIGSTKPVAADNQVALAVDVKGYDWGTIDINGGIVSKVFTIKNTSQASLKLYNVKTSCMCTTAQLKTAEKTSVKFGMHEKNSSVFEVNPGETAELIVEFDPAFHGPSGVGPISRTITMSTNDTRNPTLSFNLSANVINQ